MPQIFFSSCFQLISSLSVNLTFHQFETTEVKNNKDECVYNKVIVTFKESLRYRPVYCGKRKPFSLYINSHIVSVIIETILTPVKVILKTSYQACAVINIDETVETTIKSSSKPILIYPGFRNTNITVLNFKTDIENKIRFRFEFYCEKKDHVSLFDGPVPIFWKSDCSIGDLTNFKYNSTNTATAIFDNHMFCGIFFEVVKIESKFVFIDEEISFYNLHIKKEEGIYYKAWRIGSNVKLTLLEDKSSHDFFENCKYQGLVLKEVGYKDVQPNPTTYGPFCKHAMLKPLLYKSDSWYFSGEEYNLLIIYAYEINLNIKLRFEFTECLSLTDPCHHYCFTRRRRRYDFIKYKLECAYHKTENTIMIRRLWLFHYEGCVVIQHANNNILCYFNIRTLKGLIQSSIHIENISKYVYIRPNILYMNLFTSSGKEIISTKVDITNSYEGNFMEISMLDYMIEYNKQFLQTIYFSVKIEKLNYTNLFLNISSNTSGVEYFMSTGLMLYQIQNCLTLCKLKYPYAYYARLDSQYHTGFKFHFHTLCYFYFTKSTYCKKQTPSLYVIPFAGSHALVNNGIVNVGWYNLLPLEKEKDLHLSSSHQQIVIQRVIYNLMDTCTIYVYFRYHTRNNTLYGSPTVNPSCNFEVSLMLYNKVPITPIESLQLIMFLEFIQINIYFQFAA